MAYLVFLVPVLATILVVPRLPKVSDFAHILMGLVAIALLWAAAFQVFTIMQQ